MRDVDDLFQKDTKGSQSSKIDENSKKVVKHKPLDCVHSRKPKKMSPSAEQTIEMKAVKVLVERTKFNEMHFVADRGRNGSKIPHRLMNGGGLEKKLTKRSRKRKNQMALTSASQQKSNINGLFRIRKCYVKIPKDKVIIRLHAMQANVALQQSLPSEQKRSRGRPKKVPKSSSTLLGGTAAVVVASIATVVDASSAAGIANAVADRGLKRKNTEVADNLPAKRRRKRKVYDPSEFFIKIGEFTRTPSPRRRIIHSTSPEEITRKRTKPDKKATTQLSLGALRHKFGCRFFKSYVNVKRIRDLSMVTEMVNKKKNKKNLSVSFLETVEVFGDSSDGEDCMDYEDGTILAKGFRLKRLENGDADEEISNYFTTSTPSNGSHNTNSTQSNSVRKSGGILKRREKISFSPLKEDELSPRNEQLKRANEKMVRRDFKQLPADEDERETVPAQQLKVDKETSTEASFGEDDTGDNYEYVRHKSFEVNTSSRPIESETELVTPSNESAEYENATNQEQEESLENEKSLMETTTPANYSNSKSTATDSKRGNNEVYVSAAALSRNLNENSEQKTDNNEHNFSEKLQVSDTEADEAGTENEDDELLQKNELLQDEKDQRLAEQDDDEISERNQVNISNTSDQHFVDASELVASALLSERNEAEAVLNDVCQMAEAESSVLLTENDGLEDDVGFNTRPTDTEVVHHGDDDDDDDDDFTSVLTHPEVERSLQSAASPLVPNSQEIVVAAAAAASSQAAVVSTSDVDVTEDTFASVVAEVERFTKDVNPEIYSDDVGITGNDVMMDNVQASNSLDDIFDDDVDDDIMSSLRMSSGNIDIGHDKSLPIQVIETEVMAIPNEPGPIFDKPLGTTASILGTSMGSTNDILGRSGNSSIVESSSRMSIGRILQSVKSYVMSPGGEKNSVMQD